MRRRRSAALEISRHQDRKTQSRRYALRTSIRTQSAERPSRPFRSEKGGAGWTSTGVAATAPWPHVFAVL